MLTKQVLFVNNNWQKGFEIICYGQYGTLSALKDLTCSKVITRNPNRWKGKLMVIYWDEFETHTIVGVQQRIFVRLFFSIYIKDVTIIAI